MAMISVYSQNLTLFPIDFAYFCQNSSNIVQKLKPIPKKLKDFTKKTQGTGGFSLFDPPKNREKKPDLNPLDIGLHQVWRSQSRFYQ